MESLNYRYILRSELLRRKGTNPSYSMGAFARDIGLSKSRLSEILSERYGLSIDSAKKILKCLSLSEQESKCFLLSVSSLHSRSKNDRIEALRKLEEAYKSDKNLLSIEEFKVVSDWYHFAILELSQNDDFKSNNSWIAKKLGLKEDVVDKGIERLLKLNLMKKDKRGNLFTVSDKTFVPENIPSHYIKEYHSQILTKAKSEIYLQDITERMYSASTISIDREDLPYILKEIEKFQRKIIQKAESKKKKNDVYNFSLQFFSLTKNKETK